MQWVRVGNAQLRSKRSPDAGVASIGRWAAASARSPIKSALRVAEDPRTVEPRSLECWQVPSVPSLQGRRAGAEKDAATAQGFRALGRCKCNAGSCGLWRSPPATSVLKLFDNVPSPTH